MACLWWHSSSAEHRSDNAKPKAVSWWNSKATWLSVTAVESVNFEVPEQGAHDATFLQQDDSRSGDVERTEMGLYLDPSWCCGQVLCTQGTSPTETLATRGLWPEDSPEILSVQSTGWKAGCGQQREAPAAQRRKSTSPKTALQRQTH